MDGVRSEEFLASALERPRQLLQYGEPPPDLAALAASLGWGLSRNHPFVDGNKRTSLVSSQYFLRINGYRLAATQAEKVRIFRAVADGSLAEPDLATWTRERLQAYRTSAT